MKLPMANFSLTGVAVLLLAASFGPSRPAKAQAVRSSLPFIENDYAAALTEARKKNVELFVDLWAPW